MVILLNGPINTGKSTIAELLKKELSHTAVIEVDKLRAFVDWLTLKEAIPLNLRNAVALVKNFEKAGINSIVPYPLSQRNYDFLRGELKEVDAKIFTFTLNPSLETAKQILISSLFDLSLL